MQQTTYASQGSIRVSMPHGPVLAYLLLLLLLPLLPLLPLLLLLLLLLAASHSCALESC